MSIFDWVASLVVGYLLGAYLFKLNGIQNWILFTLGWVLFGVVAHKLAKVNTQLGAYLGLNPAPVRVSCD